jgi:hypothetical protein
MAQQFLVKEQSREGDTGVFVGFTANEERFQCTLRKRIVDGGRPREASTRVDRGMPHAASVFRGVRAKKSSVRSIPVTWIDAESNTSSLSPPRRSRSMRTHVTRNDWRGTAKKLCA